MIRNLTIPILFLQLFVTGPASSQPGDKVTENIRQKFNTYCNSIPWEDIYLQTDSREYIAGEVMWFKIFLLDRKSYSISSRSSIAYFELLNSGNKPVIQSRFRLTSGSGPGQVTLPDTLSSGKYTIRVYTNWMKNFLPANCWMEEISVYNPFDIKTFRIKKYDSLIQKTTELTELDSTDIVYQTNLLAIRNSSGTVEVKFVSDDNFRASNNNLVYFLTETRGNINQLSAVKTTGNITTIIIQGKDLPTGINHITIFDSKGKPVCEKLICTPSSEVYNDPVIQSADSFATRSKVTLHLDSFIEAGISVAPVAKFLNMTTMKDYMVFGSEFGPLPYYTLNGTSIDKIPAEKRDSLLSDLRSYWIDWNKILSDQPPDLPYECENGEHSIPGLLLSEGQQLGYAGETIVMSIPGKIAQFQYAVTNKEAKFTMQIPVSSETTDLIIQPVDTTRNYRIFIGSSFSDQYYNAHAVADTLSRSAIRNISRWSLGYQVGKIYDASAIGEYLPQPPPEPLQRFYGKPDVEFVLKDYIRMTSMEEVFFELIPRVSLKRNGTGFEMVLLDFNRNRLYDEPPVLMVDGVIFNNATVIARLDPEVIEKIDLIRGIYNVGNLKFYGIVNVITNAGNLIRLPLPDYATRLAYRAAEKTVSFLSPDYTDPDTRNSHIPDLRNTLYWNPVLKPGADGKSAVEFWTSDIIDDYKIIVNGITPQGKPFTIEKTISVR